MKTPESKELSRRQLILAALALGMSESCLNVTIRDGVTKTLSAPKVTEAPVKTRSKFENLNMAVDQYQSPLSEILERMPEDLRLLANSETLIDRCFSAGPDLAADPVHIDFKKVPNARLMSMQDVLPILLKDQNLSNIILHPASPEKDIGVVCVWYGQRHEDISEDVDGLVMNPEALASQLRIMLSGQELIAGGVRFFGTEGDIYPHPATSDQSRQHSQKNPYSRISQNLNFERGELERGHRAFDVLKELYPNIDVNGVDGFRNDIVNAQLTSMMLLKWLGPKMNYFDKKESLADEKESREYIEYLRSRGKRGEAILRDLELGYSALACFGSMGLDGEGTDVLTPGIHSQLKNMKKALEDSSFLSAQGGQKIAPNVFALQYGAAHRGIPKACQTLGVSCIEANTSNITFDDLRTLYEGWKADLELARKVLTNMKQAK